VSLGPSLSESLKEGRKKYRRKGQYGKEGEVEMKMDGCESRAYLSSFSSSRHDGL